MPNHTAWLCNVSVKVVARLIESALWQPGRIFTANSSKEFTNWADRMRSLCMHGWLVSATLRKDKHAYFLLNPHLGHGLISRLPRMGLLRWTATWTPVHFVEKGQSPRLRRKPAMCHLCMLDGKIKDEEFGRVEDLPHWKQRQKTWWKALGERLRKTL